MPISVNTFFFLLRLRITILNAIMRTIHKKIECKNGINQNNNKKIIMYLNFLKKKKTIL